MPCNFRPPFLPYKFGNNGWWRHFKLGEGMFRMVGLAFGVMLRVKIDQRMVYCCENGIDNWRMSMKIFWVQIILVGCVMS